MHGPPEARPALSARQAQAPRGHCRTLTTLDERAPGAMLFLEDEPIHSGSCSALTLLPSGKKQQPASHHGHQKPPKDKPGRWRPLAVLPGAGVSWRRKEPSVLAPRQRGLGAGAPSHLCPFQLQSGTGQRQPPLGLLILVAGTGHLGF